MRRSTIGGAHGLATSLNNIDRFCTLVEDIAEESGTRFLIVTHNRLTMARMDRLYGVKKGVAILILEIIV